LIGGGRLKDYTHVDVEAEATRWIQNVAISRTDAVANCMGVVGANKSTRRKTNSMASRVKKASKAPNEFRISGNKREREMLGIVGIVLFCWWKEQEDDDGRKVAKRKES